MMTDLETLLLIMIIATSWLSWINARRADRLEKKIVIQGQHIQQLREAAIENAVEWRDQGVELNESWALVSIDGKWNFEVSNTPALNRDEWQDIDQQVLSIPKTRRTK